MRNVARVREQKAAALHEPRTEFDESERIDAATVVSERSVEASLGASLKHLEAADESHARDERQARKRYDKSVKRRCAHTRLRPVLRHVTH